VTQPFVPERGDLVWLNFDPQAGHEQAGRRPAVVISPAGYNRLLGLALFCPITTRRKGYLWEVPLPDGLPVNGYILTDQLRSLDWRARRAEWISRLDPPSAARVVGIARRLLE
jgi:mRNA interferase MazF